VGRIEGMGEGSLDSKGRCIGLNRRGGGEGGNVKNCCLVLVVELVEKPSTLYTLLLNEMVGERVGKRRGRGFYLNFALSTRQSLPMMLMLWWGDS